MIELNLGYLDNLHYRLLFQNQKGIADKQKKSQFPPEKFFYHFNPSFISAAN